MLRKTYKIAFIALIGILLVAVYYSLTFGTAASRTDGHVTNVNISSHSHGKHQMKNDPFFKDVSHVCLSVDDETLIGAIATINSIEQNTQYPVMFHILVAQDAHAYLRKWIEKSKLKDIRYKIKVFDTSRVEKMIRVRLGQQELADPMNYARFYYAQYFPELRGNVIHIDNDCIVQGDVHDLYRIKLVEPNIAAFSDDCSSSAKRFTFVDNSYRHYINFDNEHVKDVRMDRQTCSFNTGVYVFDVDKWRTKNVTKQIEYWMVLNKMDDIYGNEKGGGGSQPPLMIVLYHKYAKLDPLWNVRHLGMTQSERYSARMIESAKLLHWSGPHKPWQQSSTAPYSSVWRKYFVPDPAGKYLPKKKRAKKSAVKE